jgi:acyl-CoA reductase-like NAD-dependent aldehyde dehydrogenase
MRELVDAAQLLPIAGQEVSGSGSVELLAPWDGALVGRVCTVGARETERAIDAAAGAMRRGMAAHERALVLERAATITRDRREELAQLLATEVAKPLKSALIEVDRAVQTFTFCASAARTLAGAGVPLDAHPAGVGHLGFTIRVPLGVVAAITPFNFPLNLAVHKVGPAIAAGCGTVLKPSINAPLLALQVASILYEAGLPRDWLSVVVGPAEEISDVLISDERVRMITFTGSSQVGWQLVSRAPQKRVKLELGNTTPLIVCADADIEAAADAAAASAFGFAGQSCISVQRILVDRRVHDVFTQALVAAAGKRKLASPTSSDAALSALINPSARDRVEEWVNEAIGAGAERLTGGLGEFNHLLPTVLDSMPIGVSAWRNEIFGPVAGIRSFEDVDEAIRLANDSDYGLQAGIYTRDLNVALKAIEYLEFGGVTINESPSFRADQMPYGGTKLSGNTKEGPDHSVREMSEERMVVIRR